MIDVSIVIPVYNSKDTIIRAVDSVLAQKNVTVEIVCVDDGSTDGFAEVIQEHFGDDSRIVLLQQDNQGAGAARNKGIGAAQGAFIGFLDADDYLLDEMSLSLMIQKCHREGVRICGAQMVLEHDGIVRSNGSTDRVSALSKLGVVEYQSVQFDYDFTSYIYERELLKEVTPCFPELSYFEDPVFLVKAMHQAGRFAVVDVEYYCYVLSPEVRAITQRQCIDLVKGIQMNLQFASVHDLDLLYRNTITRLLYEYGDWIYRYSIESEELRLLVQQVQGCNDEQKERLIKRGYKRDYGLYIRKQIERFGSFKVYGKGNISHSFMEYVEAKGLQDAFCGYVVTTVPADNSEENVQDVQEYAVDNDGGLLIVAVSGVYVTEIVDALKKNKVDNYEILDLAFVHDLQKNAEIA